MQLLKEPKIIPIGIDVLAGVAWEGPHDWSPTSDSDRRIGAVVQRFVPDEHPGTGIATDDVGVLKTFQIAKEVLDKGLAQLFRAPFGRPGLLVELVVDGRRRLTRIVPVLTGPFRHQILPLMRHCLANLLSRSWFWTRRPDYWRKEMAQPPRRSVIREITADGYLITTIENGKEIQTRLFTDRDEANNYLVEERRRMGLPDRVRPTRRSPLRLTP